MRTDDGNSGLLSGSPFTLTTWYYALGPTTPRRASARLAYAPLTRVPPAAAARVVHPAYFPYLAPVTTAPARWQAVPGVLFIVGVVVVRDVTHSCWRPRYVAHAGLIAHALTPVAEGADVTVPVDRFERLDAVVARDALAPAPAAPMDAADFLLRSLGTLPLAVSVAARDRTERTGNCAVLAALLRGDHGGMWDLCRDGLLAAGVKLADAACAPLDRAYHVASHAAGRALGPVSYGRVVS